MPLKADYAAAVLGPIRDAVQKKSTEAWGSEGIQVRSANEVVKVLLGHLMGLLEGSRTFVPWDGGTRRQRQRQEGHIASKQPRNQSNREHRILLGNRQRVRKPATLTAEQRTATRPTHRRRLTPVPQQGQSLTGGACHQRGGGQEGVVDRNRTVNSIATELGPSNEYSSVQSSAGQGTVSMLCGERSVSLNLTGNEHAAQGSSGLGPMNGVASGSRSGIPNGQPHAANNGFPQGSQGVPGIFNGGRLAPISPTKQQLPPIAFVTSDTPRIEDRSVCVLDNTSGPWSGFTSASPSNNWPMTTQFPAPTARGLSASAVDGAIGVQARSNGLPSDNDAMEYGSGNEPTTWQPNDRSVLSDSTQYDTTPNPHDRSRQYRPNNPNLPAVHPYSITSALPHGFHAATPGGSVPGPNPVEPHAFSTSISDKSLPAPTSIAATGSLPASHLMPFTSKSRKTNIMINYSSRMMH
ncbi:hypothetical protein LOZ65_005488 [Ophidiomyces ophidiicola]|nr:hypothetical protein LOZ65_005488 [Ophidiomyces ophidiicola]